MFPTSSRGLRSTGPPQDIPLLGLGQQQIAAHGLTVVALAGDPGEHIDRRVALAVEGDPVFRFRHHRAHALQDRHGVLFLSPAPDLLDKGVLGGAAEQVVVIQPVLGGDGEALLLQSFLNGQKAAGVHVAGAGTPFDGMARTAAVEGQLAGFLQGEGPIPAQQHRTARGELSQELQMVLFIIVHICSPLRYFRTAPTGPYVVQ